MNSAGNASFSNLDPRIPMHELAPPSTDPRVISVAALRFDNARAAYSHYGSRLDLIAPGSDILSTFYTGGHWGYETGEPPCTDAQTPPTDGYGPCSGTSMAAPFVTGIAALVRSNNPLLDFAQTKRAITATTNTSLPPHNPPSGSTVDGLPHHVEFGHGLPDAGGAVRRSLGTVGGKQLTNRLTPLFSFYSSGGVDYFYTTVPQMGRAAVWGKLKPHAAGGAVMYGTVGSSVAAYPRYPGPACLWSPCPYDPAPTAQVHVFTTHVNPLGTGYSDADIVPLFRLSWADTNPNSVAVRHAYTTSTAGRLAFESVGYRFDGTEGYLWRCDTSAQPPLTTKLFRKYHPATVTYALFPESELVAMLAAGYTENASGSGPGTCFDNNGHQYIGYAYPNVDADGDGIVDGMEALMGTCVHGRDAHADGIPGMTFDVAKAQYVAPVPCAARVLAILEGDE